MAQLAEQQAPVNAQVARYVADYKKAAASQPAWLTRLREEAIANFERLGFPNTRLEEWRFTPIGPIADRAFDLAPVNVRFDAAKAKGVTVQSLESVLASNPALVEPYLGRVAKLDQHFAALNTAFIRDGVVISIAPHAVVDAPIEVTFTANGKGAASVTHPRVLIVAGENSHATIIERYAGTGTTLTNAITEVVAGAGSVIDHYKVQEESADAFHIGGMHLHLARASNFSSHSITFGGAIARNDVVAVLDGEGIDCTLNGLYVGRDRQLIDNHTTIDHAQPNCGSHEIYKGILADQSHAVFNGKIVVRIDAQKTDAKQTNKALLLSDDANINTKPQLEIFANDVKCTHGAAIGQLDEDAMFYLRSRALGVNEARAMLIHAFAGDILNRIKVAPLREHLDAALTARLPRIS